MTRAELGVEYLKEAARLERYMRKVQKEPRTDNWEHRLLILKCIWNALLQGIA